MVKSLSPLTSLMNRMEGLPSDVAPRYVAEAIISWLKSEPLVLKEAAIHGYNFEEYTNLIPDNYPIHESNFSGPEIEYFKRSLQRYETGPIESAFQFLRDSLEKLFFLQIERECPNCGCWEFSVHKEMVTNCLVDMCNQCGNAYFKDGTRLKTGRLYFASNDDLKNLG